MRPTEPDALGVGAERDERRLHGAPGRRDAGEVAVELVVDPGVPVGQEDRDVASGLREVEDLARRDEVGDGERAGGLEADVRPGVGRTAEEGPDLLLGNDLLRVPDDPAHAFL